MSSLAALVQAVVEATSFDSACRQTVDALRELADADWISVSVDGVEWSPDDVSTEARSTGTAHHGNMRCVISMSDAGWDSECEAAASLLTLWRREQQLQARATVVEHRAQLLSELSASGFHEWSAATDTTSWSDQMFAIFGLDVAASAPGHTMWLSMVHPDDRDSAVTSQTAVESGANGWHCEYRIKRPDGSHRLVSHRGRIEHDEQGQVTGVAGVVTDITAERARQRAVAAIEASESAYAEQQATSLRINDTIVQALTAARWLLETDDTPAAIDLVANAITAAQALMGELMGDRPSLSPVEGDDAESVPSISMVDSSIKKILESLPEPPGAQPIRVLVADDQSDIRLLLGLQIDREPDMELVAEAASGVEALEALERSEVDVAVLDLSMPGMDGFELARRIRETKPHVRLIALSGHVRDIMWNAAQEAGFDDYVQKGASLDRVVKSIADGTGQPQQGHSRTTRAASEADHPTSGAEPNFVSHWY